MMKAHYGIRLVFDGDLLKSVDPADDSSDLKPEQSRVRWLGGDTDSSVLQIFDDQDPKIALAKANLRGAAPFFDVAGDAKGTALKELLAPLCEESRELALRRAGELGNFSDELAPHYGVEWVGLAPKMYSLSKTEGESKERAKGVPKSVRKKLDHELYRAILESGGEHKVEFRRLGCRHHVNEVVEIHKRGLTALNTKTWQLDAHCTPGHSGRHSRPLVHKDLHQAGVPKLKLLHVLEGHRASFREHAEVDGLLVDIHVGRRKSQHLARTAVRAVVERTPVAARHVFAILIAPIATTQEIGHHAVAETQAVGIFGGPEPLLAAAQELRQLLPTASGEVRARRGRKLSELPTRRRVDLHVDDALELLERVVEPRMLQAIFESPLSHRHYVATKPLVGVCKRTDQRGHGGNAAFAVDNLSLPALWIHDFLRKADLQDDLD